VGLKRACERSPCNISLERRRKGHWDFVLEEMAWMANDFMQVFLKVFFSHARTLHGVLHAESGLHLLSTSTFLSYVTMGL
jgi:hypothetical protein